MTVFACHRDRLFTVESKKLRWILPYIDQPVDFWNHVSAYVEGSDFVVYFPFPGAQTGRPKLPDRHLQKFLESRHLFKTVLLNAIVHEQPVDVYFKFIRPGLRRLHEDYGVHEVVVTDPLLAVKIKRDLPRMHVAGSVLMDIRTPLQLEMIGECLDVLTPSDAILRDRVALKRLKAEFKGRIRLMLNEGCMPGCPFRTQHFYEMACLEGHPRSLCAATLARHPDLARHGSWVLPQHLNYYAGLYDELKLDGRVTLSDPARYLEVLSAYVTGRPMSPAEIGGGPATAGLNTAVTNAEFEKLLES